MKTKIFIVLPFLILTFSGIALGAEFSLYGGKMGMTRTELDKLWIPLESGEYAIKEAPVFGIVPEFDPNDRMYKLSFSAPLPKEYPSQYASTALQKIIQELWGKDPAISLSMRTGRGSIDVTVVSKALEEEYVRHIMVKLSTIFSP